MRLLTSMSVALCLTSAIAQAGPSRIWATYGEDKVLQDDVNGEEHLARKPKACVSRADLWCDDGVRLFGMGNEVVAFQLIVAAPDEDKRITAVSLPSLVADDGRTALNGKPAACPAEGDCPGLWSWKDRQIELFLVHYLPVHGISREQVASTCEEQLPPLMRRSDIAKSNELPSVCSGDPNDPQRRKARWQERPGADKHFPEIAVPLELFPDGFTVRKGTSQSIWVDVYIPKGTAQGAARTLKGTLRVTFEGDPSPTLVPVRLDVLPRDLDDRPFDGATRLVEGAVRSTLAIEPSDIIQRYIGFPGGKALDGTQYGCDGNESFRTTIKAIVDRHHLIARRHRIELIEPPDGCVTVPRWLEELKDRVSGELFAAPGYDGPGRGKGNSIFILEPYSPNFGPEFRSITYQAAQERVDRVRHLRDKIRAMAGRDLDFVLYFCDEKGCLPGGDAKPRNWKPLQEAIQRFKDIWGDTPVKVWATVGALPEAVSAVPGLDYVIAAPVPGDTAAWTAAAESLRTRRDHPHFGGYNSARPFAGSLMVDDSGTSPRQLAWAAAKWRMDEWFVWHGTYYCDSQRRGGCKEEPRRGLTNLYADADTFHASDEVGPYWGKGVNNGNGVLFYPGTDVMLPSDKPFRQVSGPVASIRLKQWRRGIQDLAYIRLAESVAPGRWSEVMGTVVDKALWDFGITDPKDPSYVQSNSCRSDDPAEWEAARATLAAIILGEVRHPTLAKGKFTCWSSNPTQ